MKESDSALFTEEKEESVKIPLEAVNARDGYGNTLLHWRRYPESVRALVAAGADVNAKNMWGKTPLRVHKNDYEVVKTLFALGAKDEGNKVRNSLNPDGRMAFDKAKAEGLKELKERKCSRER